MEKNSVKLCYGEDMKRGFTLIELLAVIAVIAILAVFAVPQASNLLTKSKNALSTFQKNEIKDAVELYINDTCITPTSDEIVCQLSTSTDNEGFPVVTGTISLSDVSSNGYISSSEISNNCEGSIEIVNNEINIEGIECSF